MALVISCNDFTRCPSVKLTSMSVSGLMPKPKPRFTKFLLDLVNRSFPHEGRLMRKMDDISVSFDEFWLEIPRKRGKLTMLMKKSKASVKKIIRLGLDLIGITIKAN